MATLSLPFARLAQRAQGLAHRWRVDHSGLAAVEFALVLPVMLIAYFGCLEVTQGFQASRKVSILSRSLSDLTSQTSTTITATDMTNVFNASRAVLAPFDSTGTQMTVSSVVFSTVSGNVKAYTDWSTTQNGVLRPCGELTQVANGTAPAPNNIPSGLVSAGTTVIVADVKYLYTPLLGGSFRQIGNGASSIPLSSTTYMRPRSVTRIAVTGVGGNNCNPTFP